MARWPTATSAPWPGRQVEIDPRAEADQAEPLADADAVALAHEGHDAPRDQAGDLHDRDLAFRPAVAMTSARRSFSSLALSRAALRKLPGT